MIGRPGRGWAIEEWGGRISANRRGSSFLACDRCRAWAVSYFPKISACFSYNHRGSYERAVTTVCDNNTLYIDRAIDLFVVSYHLDRLSDSCHLK